MTTVVGPNTVAKKPQGSLKLLTTLASSRSPSETLVMISPCPGSWWNCRSISSNAAATSSAGALRRLCALEVRVKFDGRFAANGGCCLPALVFTGCAVAPEMRIDVALVVVTRKSGDAYTTLGDCRRAVSAWRTEAPV